MKEWMQSWVQSWDTSNYGTVCPICGDWLEIILEAHTNKHNMSVNEFFNKYPQLEYYGVNADKSLYERMFERRGVKSSTFITYNGITKTVREWSDATGIGVHNLHDRLKRGWQVDKILNTPVKRYCKKEKLNIKKENIT